MTQQKSNKYLRFSPSTNNQYIDRDGRFLDLPSEAVKKTRLGIFGLSISADNKILVSYPPHALDKPGLPGGGREGFESHAQALQREYFEELGPYFVIKKKAWPVYQQRILYYANDVNEYWQYDQYFYLTQLHHPKMPSTQWITPEGGLAQWIPLREYHRLTAAHKPAIAYYLKSCCLRKRR